MCSRVLIFLIGAVFAHYQIVTADVGELMLEGNVTMDAKTMLSVLNVATSLQMNIQGVAYTVNNLQCTPVSECLIIGHTTNCNCSTGYTWSNDVCYIYNCCDETTCFKDVTNMTLICIFKVNVKMYGSVNLISSTWDASKTTQLQNALQQLNGFQCMNITSQRLNNKIADFVAAVRVKFPTSRLQDIVTQLEKNLTAAVSVNTLGMVTILSPNTTVCYQSSPVITCTFEEATDRASWNMLRGMNERTELSAGSVVKLNDSCATSDYQSCSRITLQEVTGTWEGIYECGFTKGSVRHTAQAKLSLALLPDVITMVSSPLIADCSEKKGSVDIQITATIPTTSANYEVQWTHNNYPWLNYTSNQSFHINISCQTNPNAQNVTVTFINSKKQSKTARLDIPVIYGSTYCIAGDVWPNAPLGATLINRTCADGRVGYKSRTCDTNGIWQQVFDYCISEQLSQISNAAENFLQGLGATQDVAISIFDQLNNSTSTSSKTVADISASINILNVMSVASKSTVLKENVLPNFIDAASNMLNYTWNAVNTSVLYNMSATYLQSVEGLVQNIIVNNSNGFNSTNLDLKFCPSSNCTVSAFDVVVNISTTNGILKIVAVKKLTNKLENRYSNMEPYSLLLSATFQDNNDSFLEITLEFPNPNITKHTNTRPLKFTEPLCVFWNTTERKWSNEGCIVKAGDGNYIQCKCSHLTSFSVLFSKGEKPSFEAILDLITIVGLGVSIGSLLIFLIIESLVWSAVVKTNLAHFRHTSLVNIATFLLLADCCFLASSSPESLTDSWCLVLTICKHLFYLAMFCWMLCLSIMLVHQLIFVFSPLRKKVFMFLSSIVGYVFPILIVGSSYVYCKYTNTNYYDEGCWLVFDGPLDGSMHAFLLPVGTIVLTNLFGMMVVIFTLMKSSVPNSSNADKQTAKSILKVVVFLTPVFGLTWIFGFVCLMLDTQSTDPDNIMFIVVNFCFTILNSFQGFLIFVVVCFAEQKIREELFKIITSKSKGDTMKNLMVTKEK